MHEPLFIELTILNNERQRPNRIVPDSKDMENLTGGHGRTARKLLQKIREAFSKQPHEFIIIKKFYFFTGIQEELVKDFLQH